MSEPNTWAMATVKNNWGTVIKNVKLKHRYEQDYIHEQKWPVMNHGQSGVSFRVEYETGFLSTGYDYWLVEFEADGKLWTCKDNFYCFLTSDDAEGKVICRVDKKGDAGEMKVICPKSSSAIVSLFSKPLPEPDTTSAAPAEKPVPPKKEPVLTCPVDITVVTDGSAERFPVAKRKELLDFKPYCGKLLSSYNEKDMRKIACSIAVQFDGLGVCDDPEGRAMAYADALLWSEEDPFYKKFYGKKKRSFEEYANALYHDYSHNRGTNTSSCGMTVRSYLRLLGVRDRLIDPPYKSGSAITNVIEVARNHGALLGQNDISNITDWCNNINPGDIVFIKTKGKNDDHTFICVDVSDDHQIFYTVEGGQGCFTSYNSQVPVYHFKNDPERAFESKNSQPDGSCNSIWMKMKKQIVEKGKLYLGPISEINTSYEVSSGARPVVNTINIAKLRYTHYPITIVKNMDKLPRTNNIYRSPKFKV